MKVCLIYEYNVCADFTYETVCSPKKTAADFEKSSVNKGGLCVFKMMKRVLGFLMMCYKLLHCQEIPWCSHITVITKIISNSFLAG